jgi:hypothetical protein
MGIIMLMLHEKRAENLRMRSSGFRASTECDDELDSMTASEA